jgi:TonB family protein
LFQGAEDQGQSAQHFSWKEFVRELVTGSSGPLYFPSMFRDPWDLVADRIELQRRRNRASAISVGVHLTLGLLLIVVLHKAVVTASAPQEDVVFVKQSPIYMPLESTGPNGGGGGGGGRNQMTPPSSGRMPDTSRVQLVPPDLGDPKPLIPPDDQMAEAPTVQMPIDIPQDQSLPIGDVTAPPNQLRSYGPGSGGGIGTGRGTGVGEGSGPGVGPGSGGGMGGGSGGGIGSGVGPYVVGGGVTAPVPIFQPLPLYTEEARKSRIEGIVLIQAIIRRDGTVDSFKVVRGLGYGLDESAIHTIATKWKFRPGSMHGTPVDVLANIEVTFRLY